MSRLHPAILLLLVSLPVSGGCSALPRSLSGEKVASPRLDGAEEPAASASQTSRAGSAAKAVKASEFADRGHTYPLRPAASAPAAAAPPVQPSPVLPAAPAANPLPASAELPADLKALIVELDKSTSLDPEIRYEIIAWISQTPQEYQSQLIRQYRALVAMGKTPPSDASAAPPVSESPPAAGPAGTKPVDGAAVSAAVAVPGDEAAGAVVPATHPSPPAIKTKSEADLVGALANLIEQSRSKTQEGGQSGSGGVGRVETGSSSASGDSSKQDATWQGHVDAAIEEYQRQRGERGVAAEDLEDETRLRLLYLVAGRRDEACRAIASLDPKMQEFWSKELFGLATLMSDDWIADPSNRIVESKRCLSEALTRLGESATLFVRNLAFVTEVQSYGCYTPFPEYEFKPGQKVLLYAEVDNYQSKETPRGHHTSLRSTYEIFDSRRQKMADHQFETNEEYCRNPRRDFFTVCEFAIPEQLYPGKYELRLTVADLNGEKSGQSSITFHVRDQATPAK